MLYGSILVLLIAVFTIEKKGKPVVWNRWLCIPLSIFAISIITVSLIHPVGSGYALFAIDLLFVLPFYYYVLLVNNRSKTAFKLISLSVVVEGILSFIICFYLSFCGKLGIIGNRVMGHTSNPNFLGALGLLMLMTGLFLLLDHNSIRSIDFISAVSIGAGLFYIVGSSCRSATLSAAGCIASLIIFIIKKGKPSRTGKQLLLRGAIVIGITIVTFAIGLQMNDINYHFLEKKTIENIQEIQSNELDNETEVLTNRISGGQDIDTYSSGRARIWRAYIDNFSFLGKETSELESSFPGEEVLRAHNNMIDYYYRCGYIAGSAYVVFYILVGVYGLRMLFDRQRKDAETFIIVEAIGCYALYSLVEVATLPFIRCIPCLFFLSLTTALCKSKKSCF